VDALCCQNSEEEWEWLAMHKRVLRNSAWGPCKACTSSRDTKKRPKPNRDSGADSETDYRNKRAWQATLKTTRLDRAVGAWHGFFPHPCLCQRQAQPSPSQQVPDTSGRTKISLPTKPRRLLAIQPEQIDRPRRNSSIESFSARRHLQREASEFSSTRHGHGGLYLLHVPQG
jgi:hypothetical protein